MTDVALAQWPEWSDCAIVVVAFRQGSRRNDPVHIRNIASLTSIVLGALKGPFTA